MPSLTQLRDLAFQPFIDEVSRRCTGEERRLIEQGSFSTVQQLVDSAESRASLSTSQLERLISLGLISESSPAHARAVKGVAWCTWRLADPSSFPSEHQFSLGPDTIPGKMLYVAVVIGESGEVLGDWRMHTE